ncbi:MAG TPA: GvpL/GvpF family gas vesicle protein [Vicinamibacteria bacterium]
MIYVYGFVAGRAPRARPRGLRGEPVRFVRCGPVQAVVGDVARAPALSARALRGHDRTVRRLAAAAPALVPAAFGNVLADEAALRAAVAPRGRSLALAARRARGCRQMSLRFFGRSPRKAPRAASGTEYLQRRADHARLRDVPGAAALLARLAPLVRAERIERPRGGRGPGLVASVHHLVPEDALGRYRRVLRGGSGAGMVVTASGPSPAYAFGDDQP